LAQREAACAAVNEYDAPSKLLIVF